MNELLSLVVTIRPTEPVSVPGHLGRAVHALLLRWLDEHDAALAKRWHDDGGHKPFTCSTLVGGKRAGQNTRLLSPDRDCWFRLTSFDAEVTAALLARHDHPPQTVELDGVTLPVVSIAAGGHQWAGLTGYEALAAPYLLAREQAPRRVRLEYISPATFHQRELNLPVPLPELVFGSLADRWNAFSPVAISPEVRAFCQSGVALSSFTLRSGALPGKNGGLQIGARGAAAYVAVRYDRYWMGVLGLLADFAFYAGVGRMTTVGMGQARRID